MYLQHKVKKNGVNENDIAHNHLNRSYNTILNFPTNFLFCKHFTPLH